MSDERTPEMEASWYDRKVDQLMAEIEDMKKALAGDSSSKVWKEWKIKLTNKEGELSAHIDRRIRQGLPLEKKVSPTPEQIEYAKAHPGWYRLP